MADAKLVGKLYKILSWSSLAALILTIVLVLHKSPAPNIPFDPNAAARAEQKFEAADRAKAAGQPGQVALDRTELNSYLAQNLGLAGAPGGSAAPVGAAPAGAGSSVVPAGSGGATATDPAAVLSSNEQPTIDQVQSSVKDVKV